MSESPRNHHLHGPERPTSSETTPPKDIGTLACRAADSYCREELSTSLLLTTDNSAPSIRERKETAHQYINSEHTDTTANETVTAHANHYADLPKIPSDLFASEPMPQLRSSYFIEGEVRACVKIPSDIYNDINCLNSHGLTDADTLGVQIEACDKLIHYLDRYRDMVTFSNIRFISDELKEKFERHELRLEDWKRARRAITGLQVEVSREIDRLKDRRHKAIWGNSYSYRVDSSTS